MGRIQEIKNWLDTEKSIYIKNRDRAAGWAALTLGAILCVTTVGLAMENRTLTIEMAKARLSQQVSQQTELAYQQVLFEALGVTEVHDPLSSIIYQKIENVRAIELISSGKEKLLIFPKQSPIGLLVGNDPQYGTEGRLKYSQPCEAWAGYSLNDPKLSVVVNLTNENGELLNYLSPDQIYALTQWGSFASPMSLITSNGQEIKGSGLFKILEDKTLFSQLSVGSVKEIHLKITAMTVSSDNNFPDVKLIMQDQR